MLTDTSGLQPPSETAPAPLDIALSLATVAIENGASAVAADRAFAAALNIFHVNDGFIVWRLDWVTAGRMSGGATITQPVRVGRTNLRRVAKTAEITERALQGLITPDRLRSEIDAAAGLESPYDRWTMLVVVSVAAALFSRNESGQWGGALSALAGAGVGQLLRQQLQRTRTSDAAMTLACAATSALVASLGLRLRLTEVGPTALVASVVYLIPGMALINGFFELVSPRHLVVGVQRIVYGVLLCTLLAIGVAFAVSIMR